LKTNIEIRENNIFGAVRITQDTRLMTSRVSIRIIGLLLVPILVLASAGSKSANAQANNAQAKLDAHYTATLLGLPIGHISWAIDLKENRFTSVATGSIAGFLRLFLDAQGSVAAEGRLSSGKPVPSNFRLKLLAGKWSDDVGIVFSGNRAKESVLPASASPSADYVPIKDADRVGASDPMTALLVYVGGTGATTVPQACERMVAIFDGHTRYNLRLAFERFGMAHPDEGYQGQVVVCSAKFLPVAGYDPKHFLVTYLAAQHQTEIWLAPLGGTRLLVPYRASISTPMGVGILEATKFAFISSEENVREGH
jgi:Protein of unknown function (DUF3108)